MSVKATSAHPPTRSTPPVKGARSSDESKKISPAVSAARSSPSSAAQEAGQPSQTSFLGGLLANFQEVAHDARRLFPPSPGSLLAQSATGLAQGAVHGSHSADADKPSLLGGIGKGLGAIASVTEQARESPSPSGFSIQGGTEEQRSLVDDGLGLIARSPLGRAELEEAKRSGVEILITEDSNYADYSSGVGEHGTVRLNPKAIREGRQVAGILGHELGHVLVDKRNINDRLDSLPGNQGRLANEIVAESLSSAIARESGFLRGESAITAADDHLRNPGQGFDEILKTDYVDRYNVDRAQLTPENLAQARKVVTRESIELIQSLGGTVPAEYLT